MQHNVCVTYILHYGKVKILVIIEHYDCPLSIHYKMKYICRYFIKTLFIFGVT